VSNYGNELISIIVPVYNVERYLEKCVNSIINQTYKNLEIILVDDGATDSSGNMCDELAKSDNRIKVYHKENGGLSDARNYGVERATGDYIGFVDSDDYIDSEMYEKLYEAIKKENVDVAECSLKVIYPGKIELFTDEKYYKVLGKTEYLEEYLTIKKVFGSVWTKLIKSDVAKKLVFPKGKLYEDTYYAYDLINIANSFVLIDSPSYNYLMRENSITNSKMYAYFSVLNSILLEENYRNNEYYSEILSYFKRNYISLLKNKYITRNRKLCIILIKISIYLYRGVLERYKNILAKN